MDFVTFGASKKDEVITCKNKVFAPIVKSQDMTPSFPFFPFIF
jgi:hypothetical protein